MGTTDGEGLLACSLGVGDDHGKSCDPEHAHHFVDLLRFILQITASHCFSALLFFPTPPAMKPDQRRCRAAFAFAFASSFAAPMRAAPRWRPVAARPPHPTPPLTPATPRTRTRDTVRAGSLEDAKKRARSQYDNIPDINQQYIAELGRVERKYGPARLGRKSAATEARRSILADDGRNSAKATRRRDGMTGSDDGQDVDDDAEDVEADLGGYARLRGRLLGDTVTVGALGVAAAWGLGTARDAGSCALGVVAGLGYVWLLARGVERLATAARESGGMAGASDGLQAARVGLLAAVVVGSARRAESVSVLMVVLGFLSYKVATLLPLVTGEAFDDV